jgi:hypothetical protein
MTNSGVHHVGGNRDGESLGVKDADAVPLVDPLADFLDGERGELGGNGEAVSKVVRAKRGRDDLPMPMPILAGGQAEQGRLRCGSFERAGKEMSSDWHDGMMSSTRWY